MKIISKLNFFIFAIVATSCSQLSLAGERSLAGFYETGPGVAGDKNRLCIWTKSSDTYTVEIATISCAVTFSPDCSNAKISNFSFSSKFKNGKLAFYEKETSCSIGISFKNGKAFVTQSIGKCQSVFPNEDAAGQYLRKSELADESACAP